MSTLKDVARLANVSLATASYALNGDMRIKKKTRDKVLEVARKLNYVKNGSASSLRRQKHDRILVFVSNFGGPVHQITLEYLYTKLKEKKYDMVVCNGENARKMLSYQNFDGVINLDAMIDQNLLMEASNYGYPIIDTTRRHENGKIISLPLRGKEPVYEVIKTALKEGYKSFGYMHGSINSYDDAHRFKGFVRALNEAKINDYQVFNGNFTIESGYQAIKQYLQNNNKLPEVIFFANDEMAIGALDYLKKINFDLKSVKIIGFDNITIGKYYLPSLSTIEIDRDYWTTNIVDRIIGIIDNASYQEYDCKYKIIRRETF